MKTVPYIRVVHAKSVKKGVVDYKVRSIPSRSRVFAQTAAQISLRGAIFALLIAIPQFACYAQASKCRAAGPATEYRNNWISFHLPVNWQIQTGGTRQSDALAVLPRGVSYEESPCSLQIVVLRDLVSATLPQAAEWYFSESRKMHPGTVQTSGMQQISIDNTPALRLPFEGPDDTGTGRVKGGMMFAMAPGPRLLVFLAVADPPEWENSTQIFSSIIASVQLPGRNVRRLLSGEMEQLGFANAGRSEESQQASAGGCQADAIAGGWTGHKLTDGILRQIDISFTFNQDGTYEYSAGEGNAAWITQLGSFQIAPGNQRYPCQITLTPDRKTVRISSTAHLFILQSTDLMDDKPRTFLYQFPRWAPSNLMLAGTWTDWRNDIGAFRLERR